jgi:cyclopropane fatty-acyl-phospholipid synthase-like methyltransferase
MTEKMDKKGNERSISGSLEADRVLLPHMPYLLQDMWGMGSSFDDIVNVVGGLTMPPDQTHILDLGCGKGAVLVMLSVKYGYRVTGIDAIDPFLEVARRKADEYRVAHLCRFIKQDIHEYVTTRRDYDLVILASLGGIFGNLKETVARLRTQVKKDGYMLIDDGYLRKKTSLDRQGYEHYRNQEDTVKELTSNNDLLVREVNTTQFSLELNDQYLRNITRRSAELVQRYPELKKDLKAYVDLQYEECDVIRDHIEGALWLLQKN